MNLEERVSRLETDMSTLKRQLKDSRAGWDEVESSFKDVIRDFVITYGLKMPERLKQPEKIKFGLDAKAVSQGIFGAVCGNSEDLKD